MPMTLNLSAGMPQWMGWAYAAVALVAAITDYRSGKIYNWLTLPALLFGFIVSVVVGLPTLAAAAAGVGLAALFFIPLFLTGVLGGGDVKLLMAMGTVLGARGIFELSCASILIAALGAVVLLVTHKRVKPFFSELTMFFRTLLTPGLSVQWPRLSREIKAPFGLAIFWAFLYVTIGGHGA